MMLDRRQFGRRSVSLDGFVRVPLRAPIPCKLVNMSEGGALLAVDKSTWLPQAFRLTIGNFETECTVRHRRDDLIGVEFETPCRFDVDMAEGYMPMTGAMTTAQDPAQWSHR